MPESSRVAFTIKNQSHPRLSSPGTDLHFLAVQNWMVKLSWIRRVARTLAAPDLALNKPASAGIPFNIL
jgi:hypothetical protein